jgi:hypothetical protein
MKPGGQRPISDHYCYIEVRIVKIFHLSRNKESKQGLLSSELVRKFLGRISGSKESEPPLASFWRRQLICSIGFSVGFRLRIQPVEATYALNLSAGVLYYNM